MQKVYLTCLKAVYSSRLLPWIFCHTPDGAHFHILFHILNSLILPAATLSVGTSLGCSGVSSTAFKFQKLYGFAIRTSLWCHSMRRPEAGTAALTSTARNEPEEKFQYHVPAAGCYQLWRSKWKAKATCYIAWHHVQCLCSVLGERPKMAIIITETLHIFISEKSLQGWKIPEFQLKTQEQGS